MSQEMTDTKIYYQVLKDFQAINKQYQDANYKYRHGRISQQELDEVKDKWNLAELKLRNIEDVLNNE